MRWGVVVPVKALARAKTRLRPYADDDRRALVLAMAGDAVAAALACPDVLRVLVVTSDLEVAAALRSLGADAATEDADGGLNRALQRGAALLRCGRPDAGVVALAADLPALRPEHLSTALAQLRPGSRGVVADVAGTGTTLLAATPGTPLGAAYGPGSRQRHLDGGAVELDAADGLRLDVDTPADLARAVALGVGPRTAALAAGLAVAG